MIVEYALEPEMVATWYTSYHRHFIRDFGQGQGRLVSRYPKKWAKKAWESFAGNNDMDKKRLEELLIRLQETMVKRKDFIWDDTATWLENAVQEHARHPFRAVLARSNPANRPEVLCENALDDFPCPKWDNPHGITVNRKASDMATAVQPILACCCWVKFIDPYFVQCKAGHKRSLPAFLNALKTQRPTELPEKIELHTSTGGAIAEFLNDFYKKIIPAGLQVTLYQWQERPGGQKLHNRYILTDLGGVSFQHGLDTGSAGETDDINRLDQDQYLLHCKQYNLTAPAFDLAAPPITINGSQKE